MAVSEENGPQYLNKANALCKLPFLCTTYILIQPNDQVDIEMTHYMGYALYEYTFFQKS